MVRIKMTLGVLLAVTAFGCSEDETGMGGTTAPGACTNAADTALVCADDFESQIETCATGALGQGAATSTCLQTTPGLSTACADCYGDITQCVFDNCSAAPANCALDRESAACDACIAQNCDAAFEMCTGDVDCGPTGNGGNGGTGGNGGAGGNGGTGGS